MGNQQERSNVGLAFVAGLAVGEGCFTVNVREHSKGRYSFRPLFVVTMKDHESIEEMGKIFENNDLPCYIYRSRKGVSEFRVAGYKRVRRACGALLPYLTGDKLKVAELVNEFCQLRLSRPPKSKPSEYEIDLIGRIREINTRGGDYKTSLDILRDYTPNFNKRTC